MSFFDFFKKSTPPIEPIVSGTPEKPKTDDLNNVNKAVLIVDDEVYLRDFYSELLHDEGFKTYTATNGQEALAQVKANHPDVILLDIMMPVMDGNQVIKILNENEVTKNIPVIMLTNAGSLENMQTAKLHNAYKFFIKSNVAPEEIIKTVKEAILDPRYHSL